MRLAERPASETVDAITLEVIRNRLDAIAARMQDTLLRSAVSVILKEGEDGSSGLFAPNGDTIVQAKACPMHLAVMGPAIRSVVRDYPLAAMHAGDCYVVNDPYDGGTHLPDLLMVTPVFWEGAVVAFAVALAHHEDIGGRVQGSMAADTTELYQEGVIVPPLPLVRNGRLDDTLVRMLRRNTRLADVYFGDVAAQMAACSTGAREYQAMLRQYGLETVERAITQLLDQSERLVRTRLAAVPDGDHQFTDWLDHDGIDLDTRLPITVTVRKRGSGIEVDFTGSAAQARGPINVNYFTSCSAAYWAIRSVFAPDAPTNEGAHRPIAVTIPAGCLFNPDRNMPTALRAQSVKAASIAVLGALARMAPDRVMAAPGGTINVYSIGGRHPDGSLFGCTDLIANGWGGRPGKDGVDDLTSDGDNCRIVPAEALEASYPLRVRATQLIADSGGPGEFRGGLGVRREVEILRGPVVSCFRSERHRSSPWGLFGGAPGQRCRTTIRRRDGSTSTVPTRQILTLETGDVLVIETGGGGGYGDPLERPPGKVLADVLDRKVSAESARTRYGVVIAGDGEGVDEVRTAALRAAMAAARGPIWWDFDRGDDGKA
jgi:N-methylhydantoinase B